MSSLTTTWSPSSFQLRLAFNYRKSHADLVRVRVQKLDRSIRAFSIGGNKSGNGSGVERRRTGSTRVNCSSSADDFSGWSSTDGSGQPDDSQRKSKLGGIVGAGVVGVIFVAGITVASLCINKGIPRPKQQMEPITTEQEASLAIGNWNDRVEEEGNEGKDALQNSGNLEGKTGKDKDDPSSYVENNDATSDHRFNDDTNLGYTSNKADAINNAFIEQDSQNESAINDMSVAPHDTSELLESDIGGGSLVASNFKDSHCISGAEKPELITEQDENLICGEFANSLVSDAKSTTHTTDHQEEVPGSRETVNSKVSLDLSSSSVTYSPTESFAFNVSVNSQSNAVLESQNEQKVDVDIVDPPSGNGDSDIKIQDTSVEVNKPSMEVHNVNGGGSSGTTSVSAVAYPFESEQDDNGCKDMNGSRSLFESMNPGNFFSSAGIPAPSVVSAALQAHPGKVLVPAVVDQVQGLALAALQVLKVIESDVQPGDLCTRREYARWLVSASSALSRNTVSKVYPAMYIENVTELAFDDITPEDPDFSSIQGLAEAGLISSKLSKHDMSSSFEEEQSSLFFFPESPLSRQDLVSWKMALEKRQLPVADRKILEHISGFIDIDKINPDAWPALVCDLSAGEQGIIALAFGYTRLFQPDKPVTNAQAAVALATGEASDIVSEELARIEAESMAEKAVSEHNALVAQVEKDINASFEKELSLEREKIDVVEKLAQEARKELERLRSEREEESIAVMKERAAVDTEMEVFSRLKREVEEQLQNLMSNKVEITYEKERLSKLRKDAETENQEIACLQHELEVERKALSMARAWAEDEAKRAREQAKALEEARYRWERQGIKVVVDNDLREEANAGVTWLNAGKEFSVEGTVSRAENLVDRLKAMAADIRGKSRDTIDKIIQKILVWISILKEWAFKMGRGFIEQKDAAMSRVGGSLQDLQQSSAQLTLALKEGVIRVAGDCREGVEKFTQKFKT